MRGTHKIAGHRRASLNRLTEECAPLTGMGDHRAGRGVSSSQYASLDFSQPIAALLKLGTEDVHVAAHRSQGAIQLLHVQLPKSQYVLYLYMLWRVYW